MNIDKNPGAQATRMDKKNYFRKKANSFDAINYILLSIMALLTIYPFYNVIVVSLASYADITSQAFFLLPKKLDFTVYQLIFSDATMPRAFLVSAVVTIGGTALCLFATVTAAFALSKKTLPGGKIIMMLIIFTMYFSGGLIPFYLLCKGLGLKNNILCMILPATVNTFYLIIMKNYFKTIPDSLEESAKIDGANDLRILFSIVLPLAAPVLATVGLFYAVDRWNEYYNALLLISDTKLYPLQIVLRDMLVNLNMYLSSSMATQLAATRTQVYPQSMRMAIIVVTTIPIVLVYPLLQKHFMKGMLIGSVKG